MRKRKMICAAGIFLLLTGGITLAVLGRHKIGTQAAVIQNEKERRPVSVPDLVLTQTAASGEERFSEEGSEAVCSEETLISQAKENGQEQKEETGEQSEEAVAEETSAEDASAEKTSAEETSVGAKEASDPEQEKANPEKPAENLQQDLPSKAQETQQQSGPEASAGGQDKAPLQPNPSQNSAHPSESQPSEHTHRFEKVYWYGEPSCSLSANYYNLICSECGAFGGDGEDEVAHTPLRQERESYEGCLVYRIVELSCAVCGEELGRETECIGECHQWTQGAGTPVWSEELQDFVTPALEYCENCFQLR